MTQFRRCAAFVALAASLSGMPAFAQPGLDSMGFPGASRERSSGLHGIVNAGLTWDPDGPGPLTDRLVIGGSFRSVDGITAESIAIWDGQQWGPMGAGFLTYTTSPDPGNVAEVTALAIHNNALHAAVLNFGTASVRRWDGANWVAAGGAFNGRANALVSVQGSLVAGLSLPDQGPLAARLVRQNTNGTWSAMPGTPTFAANASVRAIVEFQGNLFVAGDFMEDGIPERIVRRTAGGQWSATQLGCQGTCTGSVRSLVIANGELFAAGDFNTADAQFPGTVRWNGSGWTAFGAPGTNTRVRSMIASPDGSLFRTNIGFVERWNGQAWAWIPPNSAYDSETFGPRLIATFAGRPVIGGEFSSLSESPRVFHIDREIQPPAILAEDGFWRSPSRGIDGYIRRMVKIGDDVIATGPIYGAGGQTVGFLARLTPQGRWAPWYDGVGFDRPTRAITQFEGDIIVSGAFSSEYGEIQDPVVRRWNGSAWIDMPGLPGLAERFYVASGLLWARARPSFDGGDTQIFQWTGAAWEFVNEDQFVTRTVAFANAIWGTRNTPSSQTPQGEIVRLENGQWQPVGGAGATGKQLLGVLDGVLYAADTRHIYRLANDEWLYAGFFPPPWFLTYFDPEAATQAHGGWYLSGYSSTGPLFVGFWDRSRWSTLGQRGGGSNRPNTWGASLVPWNDDVVVGGTSRGGFFVRESPPTFRVRGASAISRIRAGWPVPTPALPDVIARAGDELTVGAESPPLVAPGWYINGRTATPNAPPDFRFESTGPGRLRISQTRVGDSGLYTMSGLILDRTYSTSGFTPAVTFATPAYLTILPTCDPIDFNNDGSLFDPVDIDAFFSVFAEGPCLPLGATCNDIDFNNDTIRFDPRDIDAFLSVFTGGPCQ